jgi:hypothetical protein
MTVARYFLQEHLAEQGRLEICSIEPMLAHHIQHYLVDQGLDAVVSVNSSEPITNALKSKWEEADPLIDEDDYDSATSYQVIEIALKK